MKAGVLGQHAQLGVQHLQRLLRHVIRHHVVDGDLHVIQPGRVQSLNALRHQQVAVGDHAGDGARMPGAPNHVIELRMQQRLATRNSDDRRAQPPKLVDTTAHLGDGHRLGNVVKLIAIGACEIAAAHGHNVRHVRMGGVQQRRADGLQLADAALGGL